MSTAKGRAIMCSALFAVVYIALPVVESTQAQNGKGYEPPEASRTALGQIVGALKDASSVEDKQFSAHPPTFIGTLPDGSLYFEVPTIDVDDDGSSAGSPTGWVSRPVRGGKIDRVHQDEVSYSTKIPISPFNVPYVVLPAGDPVWWRGQKISIGDGAVVIRGDKRIDAVFADSGPGNKVGEMSIKAHELFGETVVVPGKKAQKGPDGTPLKDVNGMIMTDPALVTRNSASKGPFIVIVFPHTSAGAKFVGVDESLKSVIEKKFAALAAGSGAASK